MSGTFEQLVWLQVAVFRLVIELKCDKRQANLPRFILVSFPSNSACDAVQQAVQQGTKGMLTSVVSTFEISRRASR